MKLRLIILFIFIGVFAFANNPPAIDEVRDSFFYSWEGECGATELHTQLQDLNLSNPVIIAYKGAAEMTMANCVSNPWKKYQYFKDGKKELEAAIEKEPDNIEIRYLRFAVQENLPGILNYNNLEEDKEFLIESLILQTQNNIPDEYINFVMEQLIQSEELSQEEKSKLNLLLSRR